jgi:2-dehydropantoate 2-reductase
MTTIALIGPGAIGGTFAAWLTQVPGNDVVLCARTPFERLLVRAPGGQTLEATPRVLTDPRSVLPAAHAARVDWVVAVTKTYATGEAARWIERLVGPETAVAVVQNGVEHLERFRGLVPPERTLPVITDVPAERTAPGQIWQRRHGVTTVPEGELGRRFVALFHGTPFAPVLTDDFLTASWTKLVLNSAGVVNALTLKPAGVASNEKAAALMQAIATETLSVGQALGARLREGWPAEIVARFRGSPPDSVNSLLADRLAGRPLEIDARNGVVVRRGAEVGIPTPLNAMAVAILEAATE